MSSWIERRATYVLRQQDPVMGRLYYVGSTTSLLRRLGEHASGSCAATTALFCGDFELDRAEFPATLAEARRREDELTVQLAAEHGLARVYGAEFAAVPRPSQESALLLRRVDAFLGRCYRCHRVHRGACEGAAPAPAAPSAPSGHPLTVDPLFRASRDLAGTRRVNVGDARSPAWSTLEGLAEMQPARLLADLLLRAGSTAEKPSVWYGHRCLAVNSWACRDEEELQRVSPELREAVRRARSVPLENPDARPGDVPRVKRSRADVAVAWEVVIE